MAEQFTTLASLTVDGKGSYGIGASAVPFSKDLYTYLRITDIKDDGTLANVIEEKETQIDDINKRIKKQNLKRVKKEKTSPEIGIYVNELAINYERMADHCENIAMSLVSEQENEAGGVPE